MAARLFAGALLGVAGAALPWGGAAAQTAELRVGAAWSSRLVRDEIARGAAATTVQPALAPHVAAALLVPLRPRLQLDLSLGAARSSLRGKDAGQEWSAQPVTVVQGLVGARYATRPATYLRGGMGAVHYFGGSRGLFSRGSGLRPALEVGGGWRRAAGAWQFGADLSVQAQSFGTPALADAGGTAGLVGRVALALALTRVVRP